MRSITLDELPKWSPWPARIMGFEPWESTERTPEKITEEYDSEKYAKCKEFHRNFGLRDNAGAVRVYELGSNLKKEVCISEGDELRIVSLHAANYSMIELRDEVLKPFINKESTIVELGCGYGANFWFLTPFCTDDCPKFVGGEFSKNAVELAEELFKGNDRTNVFEFDFLDPESYSFLDDLEGPITLFTCHAIEQLSTVAPVLECLSKRKDKIKDVFHFEPVYNRNAASLLGMMRKRYTEINGYNRNLLFDLKAGWGHRIDIISHEFDVFGINPLNPTSVIHWRFK